MAADICVFDINGDGTFDKADIAILQKSNSVIEGKYPELAGSFGDYFFKSNGYLTRHMILLDTRGKGAIHYMIQSIVPGQFAFFPTISLYCCEILRKRKPKLVNFKTGQHEKTTD